MPRKQTRPVIEEIKEESSEEEEVISEEEIEEEEEPPKKPVARTRRKEPEVPSTRAKKVEPKTEPKAPAKRPVTANKVPVSEPEKPVRKSRTITKEDILTMFEDLEVLIDGEIERIRENKVAKGTGVQFLRGLKKRTRLLKNSTNRVMKQKQKTTRKNNNSGFLKPVLISTEMSKFINWDPKTPTSRVDVTRFLCDYIKTNDLQNPKDKREILADDKLKRLLKYNPNRDPPLTYFRMQTFMKPHFSRLEGEAAPAVKTTPAVKAAPAVKA